MQDAWTKVMIEFRLMEAIRVLESVNVGPLGPSTKTSNYPDPVLSYVELLGAVDGRSVRTGRIKVERDAVAQGEISVPGDDGQWKTKTLWRWGLRCDDMGEEVGTVFSDPDPANKNDKPMFVPKTHWAKGFARPAVPSKAALTRAGEVLGWQNRGGNWLRYLQGHRQLLDVIWLIYGRDMSLREAARAFSRWRRVREEYSPATLGRWRESALSCIANGLHAERSAPSEFERRLMIAAAQYKKNHLTMRQMRQILHANQ